MLCVADAALLIVSMAGAAKALFILSSMVFLNISFYLNLHKSRLLINKYIYIIDVDLFR